jgi:hypothetical protein
MYGTVCILYPAATRESDVLATLDAWQHALMAKLGQPITGLVYRAAESERAASGQGELIVAIAFPDEAAFRSAMAGRANDPHFGLLTALLTDEPIFLDGPVVWSSP